MPPSVTASLFLASDWGAVVPVPGISVFEPSAAAIAYVEKHGLALTLRDEVGRIVAYMGVRPLGARRVEVWAVIDCHRTLREFSDIHAIAQRHIDTWDADRLEAFVECEFDAGHRWLRRLGFTMEAERMRRYLPDGKDCALYARVRGEGGQWDSPS